MILITWKAKMGRSWSEVSPEKNLVKPYLKNKLGVVAQASNPSYSGAELGESRSKVRLGKTARPYLKTN
jgi:hypothetical protein